MRIAVLVAIGMSMIGLAGAGDKVDVARKPIQIPAEELRAALQALGEVEGLYMVFLSEDVGNRNTSGVSGSLTYVEALEQLLRGTGLTYRFLEAHTVVLLPAGAVGGAPVEPFDTRAQVGQVTVTAARQSDAQQLEYFRVLAALPRAEYKRLVDTLPFTDVGTVSFPGGKGPEGRLPLGQHIQSAGVDGLVLWRVLKLTPTKIESELQVHNSNSFPLFVEIDFRGVGLGRGPYAAIGPGETAIWSWPPVHCGGWGWPGAATSMHALADPDCSDSRIQSAVARVRVLKE